MSQDKPGDRVCVNYIVDLLLNTCTVEPVWGGTCLSRQSYCKMNPPNVTGWSCDPSPVTVTHQELAQMRQYRCFMTSLQGRLVSKADNVMIHHKIRGGECCAFWRLQVAVPANPLLVESAPQCVASVVVTNVSQNLRTDFLSRGGSVLPGEVVTLHW